MSVVDIAKSYVGKTELPQNSGFSDKIFEQKMKEVGFVKSHAWCSYFSELAFKEAYQRQWWELEKLFSGSTVQTFNNFKKAKYKISNKPFVGALVIWQTQKKGVPQSTGHAGVVVEVIDDTTFRSVEGNTVEDNASGDERNGYIVAIKKRKVKKVINGLQVMGFIHIK